MRKYSRILSAIAAILLIAVAFSSALAQQIITVTTTMDGGFICFPGPCPPQCALRDAITAANENRVVNGCAAGQSSSVDTITVSTATGSS